jgi:Tol biopolymer transport system component
MLLLAAVVFITFGWFSKQNQVQKQEQEEFEVWAIPNIDEGAEFYFSPDGESLIGNAKFEDDPTHQVYTFKIDGTDILRINDKGEDACSYYFPDGKRLVYTSTKDHPDLPKGDWSNANDYPQGAELYICDLDGSNVKRLTNNEYYDAEVSVSPDGEWILFGRQTEGKMDLWLMRPDGSDEHQITFTEDWQEGGAFFIDNETIIYRAWERKVQGTRPMPMSIYTMKKDGSEVKRITHDDGTNWAPYPSPDKEHFVFVKFLQPRNYEIYLMSLKTGKQTRLTYYEGFDGLPSISPDGKLLQFASNRGASPEEKMKIKPYLMDISSLNIGPKE